MSKRAKIWSTACGLLVASIVVALSVYLTQPRAWKPGTPDAIPQPTALVPTFNVPPLTPDDPIPESAYFGYNPDPDATQRFLDSLREPNLRQAAPALFDESGNGNAVLLYPAFLEAYRTKYGREWVCGRQGIGDCVSWGWAHGASIGHAVSWKLGEVGTWHEAATEPIYGGSRVEARGRSRGGYSDGSYGGAAAKWCRDWGIVYRLVYPGGNGQPALDLTTYSSKRAKDWGNFGCGGDGYWGTELDKVAKQHPAKHVALVTTWDELVAAIRNGYPVPVCSGKGFASTRDSDGFCRQSGSWSHCMCFIGVRFDREGALCLNSWGPSWVNGPKWPDGKGHDPNNPRGPPPAQPDGSFWVDRRVVESMLSGRDSFAVSDQQGWPARKLDHRNGW